jgi:type II secretory pathway pseudopilin PulG
MRSGKPRAFTIVEMIIVIAIIVCLFTIMLPVLGRAREQGKRAQCLSNLRQLTTAWLAYAGDNGRQLCSPIPGLTSGGWVTSQAKNLGLENGLLWPYLKDTRVYVCPADQTINNTKTSFQLNGLLGGSIGTPFPLRRLDDVAQPAKTFVFIEAAAAAFKDGGRSQEVNGVQFLTPIYPAPVFKLLGYPGNNHMGPSGHAAGTGLSFADGHALFWLYTDPRTGTIVEDFWSGTSTSVTAPNSPDVYQLEAWSGGPVPPNTTQ